MSGCNYNVHVEQMIESERKSKAKKLVKAELREYARFALKTSQYMII